VFVEADWLNFLASKAPGLAGPEELWLPLGVSLAMAWTDLRTRRIPNYLTFGGAAAGMGYHLGYHGWSGLAGSLAGLVLGLSLLLLPYAKGGLGAGDVKALAAMGAWLGVLRTFYLFIYMGLSGGLLILAVLWWRGRLWSIIRRGWVFLVNLLLCPPQRTASQVLPLPQSKTIPYGLALALGMSLLCWRWQAG
jgi:prepilin peptidase CpaA